MAAMNSRGGNGSGQAQADLAQIWEFEGQVRMISQAHGGRWMFCCPCGKFIYGSHVGTNHNRRMRIYLSMDREHKLDHTLQYSK